MWDMDNDVHDKSIVQGQIVPYHFHQHKTNFEVDPGVIMIGGCYVECLVDNDQVINEVDWVQKQLP